MQKAQQCLKVQSNPIFDEDGKVTSIERAESAQIKLDMTDLVKDMESKYIVGKDNQKENKDQQSNNNGPENDLPHFGDQNKD